MSVVNNSERGEMTLAFSLAAIQRVADPPAVFADARTWSRHVGIVGDDIPGIERFVDRHGLQQDFEQGDRDRWLALAEIAEASDAPRKVHVGAGPERRPFAQQAGWEYRTIDEAAQRAGWELTPPETRAPSRDGSADEDPGEGPLDRLRRLFGE